MKRSYFYLLDALNVFSLYLAFLSWFRSSKRSCNPANVVTEITFRFLINSESRNKIGNKPLVSFAARNLFNE